jgi:hypothetical protein
MELPVKSHRTLDESFDAFTASLVGGQRAGFMILRGVTLQEIKDIFAEGWYACANEINEGEDSDWLQERLYEEGFLRKYEDNKDDE